MWHAHLLHARLPAALIMRPSPCHAVLLKMRTCSVSCGGGGSGGSFFCGSSGFGGGIFCKRKVTGTQQRSVEHPVDVHAHPHSAQCMELACTKACSCVE